MFAPSERLRLMRYSPRRLLSLCVLSLLLTTAPAMDAQKAVAARAHGGSSGFAVRVLVITMFSYETAPWLKNERLPLTFHVPGAYSPLWCNPNGLCVMTTNEGKSNAATSLMAVLLNPQFSFPHGYLPLTNMGTNVFHLNERLANLAYRVTRGLKLVDTSEAVANRKHYPGQAGKHPY